jgi:simple sugar transport system ATP-binding protein
MDEPTTALTHTEVSYLFELVNKLKDRGVALVFVSHKLEEALKVSQDVTILRSGKHIISGPADQFDRKSLTKFITGRDVDEVRKVTSPDLSESPVLTVSNLSRSGAFSDVSFTLHKGEILGITGLLGSGRTEIAEALFGVLPADSGTILLGQEKIRINSIQDAIKVGIGYLPEDRLTQGLFLDKSIGDNMIAGSLDKHTTIIGLLRKSAVAETIQSMFDRLKIKAKNISAPVKSLSGGNAQRVVLGKVLAHQPKVLILNGPTVGVDVGSKEQILEILRHEANLGMAVILISDDSPELVSVCNRVLVVRQGKIAGTLTGTKITTPNIQEMTTV